jgi:hypothetical protein
MIPDFKGHHFVEDSKLNEFPIRHHCARCEMKAVSKPDGSTDFDDGTGAPVGISGPVPLNIRLIPPCK